MSRLINTEEFIKRIDHYPPDIRNTAKKELRYCKTVDAVPVVRCKDCKYYEIYELKSDGTDDKRYKPSVCVKEKYAVHRKPDWFCADGEKVNKDGIILKMLWDISLLLTELDEVTE